jgi:hypothetical protein
LRVDLRYWGSLVVSESVTVTVVPAADDEENGEDE